MNCWDVTEIMPQERDGWLLRDYHNANGENKISKPNCSFNY
jgi:hypothetical protein